MNFKLPKTHVQSFLGVLSDITKDFKSQLLENYSTNFIWNTCAFVEENNWRLSACFIRYFFSDIIVCSIVWRTEISMKYSDAANTFLVGGMNFNQVCKEVSKDIPFILVSGSVVCCEGEPVSSSMCSPSQISIRFRFCISWPCSLFASFRYACPFPQFSGLA